MKLYVLKTGKEPRVETVEVKKWGSNYITAEKGHEQKFRSLFSYGQRVPAPRDGYGRHHSTFYGFSRSEALAGARVALERDRAVVEHKLSKVSENIANLDKFLAEQEGA